MSNTAVKSSTHPEITNTLVIVFQKGTISTIGKDGLNKYVNQILGAASQYISSAYTREDAYIIKLNNASAYNNLVFLYGEKRQQISHINVCKNSVYFYNMVYVNCNMIYITLQCVPLEFTRDLLCIGLSKIAEVFSIEYTPKAKHIPYNIYYHTGEVNVIMVKKDSSPTLQDIKMFFKSFDDGYFELVVVNKFIVPKDNIKFLLSDK